MILSDGDIRKAIESGEIEVDPRPSLRTRQRTTEEGFGKPLQRTNLPYRREGPSEENPSEKEQERLASDLIAFLRRYAVGDHGMLFRQ